MGIDHNKRLKEHLYYYSARISRDISNLIPQGAAGGGAAGGGDRCF